MKAPFPWFGGKSKVAHLVWDRFGNCPNYIEPFFGSGAVLLSRPTKPGIETVNDMDCYLANFWRALKCDHEAVANYADWPVNEADLTARHTWLVNQADFRERMKTDPDYYDVKIAGWWVWGLSVWIGSGWCENVYRKRPHLGGIGKGVNRQLPHLGNAGQGINRQLPHLCNAGRGINRKNTDLKIYFEELSNRLRNVRVCCGDWSRVLGPAVTVHNGLTGVFLDPPYASDRDTLYAQESFTVAHDVRKWAIENGDNPQLRIALCGYEGEHEMPESWRVVEWKAQGGYANKSKTGLGRENRHKERIWFSPHCLRKNQQSNLFDV